MLTAQVKMKALVISRLLLGHFPSWVKLDSKRLMAGEIANRRAARSVSVQIGRGYPELLAEVHRFIDQNFSNCGYDDLARLCDAIILGSGLSLRLDEFESRFFPCRPP